MSSDGEAPFAAVGHFGRIGPFMVPKNLLDSRYQQNDQNGHLFVSALGTRFQEYS